MFVIGSVGARCARPVEPANLYTQTVVKLRHGLKIGHVTNVYDMLVLPRTWPFVKQQGLPLTRPHFVKQQDLPDITFCLIAININHLYVVCFSLESMRRAKRAVFLRLSKIREIFTNTHSNGIKNIKHSYQYSGVYHPNIETTQIILFIN